MTEQPLSPMEKEEIKTRTLALTDNQKAIVLAYLPTTDMQAELERRLVQANKKVDMIYNVIANNQELDTLNDLQKFIKELKDCLL